MLKKISKSKASNYVENHIQARHKLLKTSYKQKILKAATKKMTQENSRLMMGDFSSNSEEQKKQILKNKRKWNDILKHWKKLQAGMKNTRNGK